ncbi:MAG: hypothetical protein JNJ57_09690 [Saprospiraceae bacterium]|nr:hypothetical protein [Saprospiraceae bacterium]
MKSNLKNSLPYLIALLAVVLVSNSACRKDPEEVLELLSNSEAAEIVETALASKTAGFTMPAIDAAQIIEAYLNNCNVPGDTTLSKSKAGGAATYNYTFNMDWLITCSGANIPQSAAVNISANGAFTSLHWSGSDATSGNLKYTGLDLQSTAYIINGSYNLEGDITGTLRKVDPSFDCVTELDLVDLTISKESLKVTGGTGTVHITGATANGTTKTLDGTLTFNNDGTATVKVNGYEHTFQL